MPGYLNVGDRNRRSLNIRSQENHKRDWHKSGNVLSLDHHLVYVRIILLK